MIKKQLIISICSLSFFLFISFAAAGTISDPYEYAWSNNVGYINFENVIVNSNTLSGYAWSANAGWINFAPAEGGVINDGEGNLSGFAWGENLGWINFSGVTINPATGKFSGTANGALAGTITFDCAYCDVVTDWRPNQVSAVSFTGGGASFFASPEAALFSNQTPSPLVQKNSVAVNTPISSSFIQTKTPTISGGLAPILPIVSTTSTSTKIVNTNVGTMITATSTAQKNSQASYILYFVLLLIVLAIFFREL